MNCIKQPPHHHERNNHLTTYALKWIPRITTYRRIHVIQLMQLRRSHSAIIKSPHTYVSVRVAYDGLDEGSPKVNTPVLITPSHDKASSGHREMVWNGVEAEEDK